MIRRVFLLISIAFAALILPCFSARDGSVIETKVVIITSEGVIKVKLYNETPRHRDNFIKLVNSHFYDSTLFHRVIHDFMIQGGDPDSKNAKPGANLGEGGPGYTIPAEFMPEKLYHKKGVLAAARNGDDVNPTKASSGSQFYIVQGKVFSDAELNMVEERIVMEKRQELFFKLLSNPENNAIKLKFIAFQQQQKTDSLMAIFQSMAPRIEAVMANDPPYKFSPEQRAVYETVGGTPHLDGSYTVFGEVVEGMDVVDKIAAVKTLPGDRPEKDVIVFTMKVEK